MVPGDEGFAIKELIPFAGALLTGAIGGCVACIQRSRTQRETVVAFALGYMITGMFGAAMALAACIIYYPAVVDTWSKLFLVTGFSGVVVSLALAAGHMSMKLILKKFGLEITINVDREKS